MSDQRSERLRFLLVEDSAADAALMQRFLEAANVEHRLHRVESVEEARVWLDWNTADAVLLDLHLPDSKGPDTVVKLRRLAGETPIVVFSNAEDDDTAMLCVRQGAQDYMSKARLRPVDLRRVVTYAVVRAKDARMRALEATLTAYRSIAPACAVQGSAAVESLRERDEAVFRGLVDQYGPLMGEYMGFLAALLPEPRSAVASMADALAEVGATAADVMELHAFAFEKAAGSLSAPRTQLLAGEGRQLALCVMGRLVDLYRARVPTTASDGRFELAAV
ncbi:MAG: response regulator [Planctomycetota bacterium]